MKHPLVIGSRGSKLALWQAEHVQSQLKAIDPTLDVRIDVIKTTGDVKTDPLTVIGGKGVFTKELEDALLDGRVDMAVHSLKDLPTILPDQLMIAAICQREDPRDALILREPFALDSLADLPDGAVVGTSSQRRIAQLKSICPRVVVKDLRGNVDTRLRKLDEGQYDSLILASAGLRRLGLQDRINFSIPAVEMLPAVGQGAIAIETHVQNELAIQAAAQLQHEQTRIACLAERALLRSLGGGCQLPIAGHAIVEGQLIRIEGLVASPDGARIVRDMISGPAESAAQLGAALGQKLRDDGADSILQESLS
ncbi:MAG TPA: hydroxymethylbilane synthase [Pyrinomonadaceae bacterium]|nr:hydroxymethylbilane synthase [Pyrinomonadaceae bacterium]